jgi:hypothetical protein
MLSDGFLCLYSKLTNYRRHAYSDLRPYVCIVEDCKANSVQFASRSEFAAHLTEHQSYKTWRCTKCDISSQSFHFIQDHVARNHPLSTPAQQGCQIEELSHLRDLSTQPCHFCNDIPGHANFIGHICHHLEETSLSAIPREEDEFDEDARQGMSWEGNSSGDADKSEIERAAVEEILEKPKPEPTTGLDRDEGAWGERAWGASTSKKDKKKRKDKNNLSTVSTDWLGWVYDYNKGCYVNSRINSDGGKDSSSTFELLSSLRMLTLLS